MRIVLLIAGLLIPHVLLGQGERNDTSRLHIWESGLPEITTYTPSDYKAAAQNWCFVQDDNGIMYIGNGAGVLEFDSITWRLIKLPNESRVNSLAKRNDGTIFLGGSRDFGYLMADSLGQMRFHSLLPRLETEYHDFSDVWYTYAVQDTIYFITEKYLFRWANNSFKVLLPRGIFGFGFLVRDKIYVDDRGTGLVQLTGDSLRLIPGGAMFNNGGITAMSPYGTNDILIIHALDGTFLYDHHKVVPFKNKLIKNRSTYGSIILPNNDLMIYSIGGGAYVVDQKGNVRQRFNKKRGLISDVIYNAFVDRDGGLWLACDNGINRIEITSPFRTFNDLTGLTRGAENTLVTSQGLYVSTTDGLFHLSQDELGFRRIDGIDNMTRDLVPVHDDILAGNLNALYWIDTQNQSHEIQFGGDAYNILLKSSIDSTKVYVAGNSGHIYELRQYRKEWQLGDAILGIDGRITQMIEYPDTTLWINTRANGMYRIREYLSNTDHSAKKRYVASHFDLERGIPSLRNNFIYKTKDILHLSTQSGLYLFDRNTQTFIPDTLLMDQINLVDMSGGIPMYMSGEGLWIAVNSAFQDNKIFLTKNGIVKEIKRARRLSNSQINNIYTTDNGIVFFSGTNGVIAYNTRLNQLNNRVLPIQIRKVYTKNDSLIYLGHHNKGEKGTIELPFQNSAIRFTYALPSYDKPEANQYQFYLEGFDEKWSEWIAEAQRDFTNLPEGDYRFRVRGRDVYGQVSKATAFTFTILPPWYRTWWAYLLYGLASAGMVGLIVQWRSEQLRKEKKALERIVKERTNEISQKNEQLKKQAQKLEEMDHQKSHFFANISHEFRTPLTLIKGPVEYLKEHPEKTLSREHAEMIRRNADRLLRLVNQLLDLAKLDADTMHLDPTPGDIWKFLHVLAASFCSHAERREMSFVINVPTNPQPARFDHDTLENIVYNLLSNAFKFTPDKGTVGLKASIDDNKLNIEVSDTGKGIPAGRLSHIFDRFYQVDGTATKGQEGTGIGLALTKALVSLMEGEIAVKSAPGKGSTFSIQIPIELMEEGAAEVLEYGAVAGPAVTSTSAFKKERFDAPAHQSVDADETSIILIVEDNADMCHFIREQLEADYQILEAMDGEEGWETAVAEIPNLIITDLMMPGIDGMGLCHRIKTDEKTSHIPVIMLTAKAGQEHKIEGLETGADSYLTKPFDRKELLVRVKNLIAQRQKLLKKYSQTVLLEPRQITLSSLDEQFLQKVRNLLEANLSDADFGVSQMQEALAMSKTQLHRKMKALTDHPPGGFLRNYRLKRAAQILAQQGDSITQVAYSVGFNNLSYFSKCFKELHNVTPSEYMKSVS